MSKFFIVIFMLFFWSNFFAQAEDELQIKNTPILNEYGMDPLAPAKAAFYSAILPGLGQAYNKKYWKIPVIYGALGASLCGYKWNNDQYNRVFDALKLEQLGKPHEFENLDIAALERAIKNYKKQRDLMLFVTIGLYALNILEANVDAHLPDKKIDSNFSFKPNLFLNPVSNNISYGVSLSINL